jgi:hypothetical protein
VVCRIYILILPLLIPLFSCAARTQTSGADRVDPGFQPFEAAVAQYLELRRAEEKKVSKLPDRATPEQIAGHKDQLGAAIRSARSTARQGDVFVPSVRPRFVEIVRSEVKGPSGSAARGTIKEDDPAAQKSIKVEVNAPYPPGEPVTTVPPTLLLRLPQLPDELEYRFIGRVLVLKDVTAGLIIDYLPGVLP